MDKRERFNPELSDQAERVVEYGHLDSVFMLPSEQRRMVGSEVIGQQDDTPSRVVDPPVYLRDVYLDNQQGEQ